MCVFTIFWTRIARNSTFPIMDDKKKSKDSCLEPTNGQDSGVNVHPRAEGGSWDCEAILGDKLVTSDGIQATKDVLKDKKYIGLYFSASW